MQTVATPLSVKDNLASLDLQSLRATARPTLPMSSDIKGLVGQRGIRLGSTVAVIGSTSLLQTLLRTPTQQGFWSVVVGMPTFGVLAAAEIGVAIERLLFVHHPKDAWITIASSLLDAFPIVVLQPTPYFTHSQARRLSAKAQARHHILITYGEHAARWPQCDYIFHGENVHWDGVSQGYGYLHTQKMNVAVRGKGILPHQSTFARLAS